MFISSCLQSIKCLLSIYLPASSSSLLLLLRGANLDKVVNAQDCHCRLCGKAKTLYFAHCWLYHSRLEVIDHLRERERDRERERRERRRRLGM
jgi:hypothetical protein